MSDTPRTDEQVASMPERFREVVHASFARQLERELAQWHEQAARQIEALTAERNEARKMLGECYIESGADTDGNPPDSVHVWPHAVQEVKTLRKDYDDACDEVSRLTAERDRLRELLREVDGQNDGKHGA